VLGASISSLAEDVFERERSLQNCWMWKKLLWKCWTWNKAEVVPDVEEAEATLLWRCTLAGDGNVRGEVRLRVKKEEW